MKSIWNESKATNRDTFLLGWYDGEVKYVANGKVSSDSSETNIEETFKYVRHFTNI